MSISDIQNAIRLLPDEEYTALQIWIGTEEYARRQAQAQIDAAKLEVVEEVWDTYPESKPRVGDPSAPAASIDTVALWRAPVKTFEAYPPQSVVAHRGKVWRNVSEKLNTFEPGTGSNGWVEVTIGEPEVVEATPDDATPAAENTTDSEETPTATTPAREAAPWQPGTVYGQDDLVDYDGKTYRVLIAHTSARTSTPGTPMAERLYTPA